MHGLALSAQSKQYNFTNSTIPAHEKCVYKLNDVHHNMYTGIIQILKNTLEGYNKFILSQTNKHLKLLGCFLIAKLLVGLCTCT